MGNVLTIYKRELKSYFTSPIAYIFIIAFLVVMAVYFFGFNGFFQRPNPDLRAYFEIFPLAFALLIPPVTMRLWSEEKKAGTMEVLMTLPVKSWEAVFGKFLAGYTVVVLTLLLTLTVPLSVQFVVDLDWGVVISSYIGALILAGVYIAVGASFSALTENQIVALLVSMVFFILLWGVSYPPVTTLANGIIDGLGNTLSWFGTYSHYLNFVKGLINPVDLVYAFSMVAFFLILNNFAVEWRKY